MNTLLEHMRSSIQLTTFVVLLAAGALFLLVSWILGQFGGDHGDHSDHVDADTGHETVSVFSPKIIAIFAIGLGAGGTLATYYGKGPVTASLIGLATGASLGGLMLLMLGALYRQQASSNLNTQSAVGKRGTVTIDIVAGATGEVGLSVSGQYNTFFARTSGGETIGRGREVEVVSVNGSTLVVKAV